MTIHYFATIMNMLRFELEPTIGPNKVCVCNLIVLYCGREVKSFVVSKFYSGYSRSIKMV